MIFPWLFFDASGFVDQARRTGDATYETRTYMNIQALSTETTDSIGMRQKKSIMLGLLYRMEPTFEPL